MIRVALPLLALAVGSVASSSAQSVSGSTTGLAFGDDLPATRVKLESLCDSLDEYDLEAPRLPLARAQESHLTCRLFSEPEGRTFDLLLLRFADGELALIEIRGAKISELATAGGEAMVFEGFEIHTAGEEVVVIEGDRTWIARLEDLTPHPSFIPSSGLSEDLDSTSAATGVAAPSALVFGATLDETREALVPLCAASREFEVDPPNLPTSPQIQTQIDCFGFPYAGYPRKLEAVFADGLLQLVWILTGKAEESRLRSALVAEFGEPVHVAEDSEVFGDGRVVLRKDKPEVLLLSSEMAALFAQRQGLQ